MSDNSKIEWTDATWTPVQARRKDGKTGVACVKVSPECANCYAERFNMRGLPSHGTGLPFTVLASQQVETFLNEKILFQPLRWKRPRKIFVCSQTDLFGEWVPDELIDQVFGVMALCPQHTFQVLTKRADRMRRWMTETGPEYDMEIGDTSGRLTRKGAVLLEAHGLRKKNAGAGRSIEQWPLPNVWLGVTAGTQKSADERIPHLKETPAALRFLSCEPLLERVEVDLNGIDWVIAGGESGPGARPMHPDWARSLLSQCRAAGVPFFFKQWGEWQNGSDEKWRGSAVLNDGRVFAYVIPEKLDANTRDRWPSFHPHIMSKVGKKAAGRLLDGAEWSQFPEVKG